MTSPKRFEFRTYPKYDLALLTETESVNPFSVVTNLRKPYWDEVAKNLQTCNYKLPVTGRSCRQRVRILLDDFKADENLSKRASGIEEAELSEMKHLLVKITELNSCTTESMKRLYTKVDRAEAEKIRETALAALGEDTEFEDVSIHDEEYITSQIKEAEVAEVSTEDAPPRKRIRRIAKGDMIGYLEAKHKADYELKLVEIEIRPAEADNRRAELSNQKEKKMNEFKLRTQEQKERSAMTLAIFELLKKKSV